jgi:caffeoyl-CoA O-methyltransferase
LFFFAEIFNTPNPMELISPQILAYCEQHTTPESPILQHINRETHAKVLMPRMLSGHLQGSALAMFSLMLKPRYVLEIGTYTGYSAICLAQGLQADGHLHTIDSNEELADFVQKNINEAGLQDKISLHIGKALEVLPTLPPSILFDLVFIDADKLNYANYYDRVIEKIAIGGFIIADNVLWSGKVVAADAKDKDTQAIRDFNDKIQQDPRVSNTLLPIRDGLMVARRIC